ncbi:F14N23.24 [Arabidopsis thaliana]|nr:F14N23.24 [Arabidopsis thaliana]
MATEDVKLIGSWASVYVMRARIALHLKSISYEFLQETYGSKSELLLKSNPVHKKMPVLIHADKPVCESNIIVHYIDEAWNSSGPSILPSHPYDRAIARFWAAYIDDQVHRFQGKPFFNGDHIGYLDIALGSFLGWWRVVELDANHKFLDETKTPSLVKWAERFCDDPAVKPIMPEITKLAEFARKLFPKRQA